MEPSRPRRWSELARNRVSIAGAVIALLSLANIVFLVLAIAFSTRPNPYLGVFAYLLLPAIMLVGLALIPAGIALERRRQQRAPGAPPRLPTIDLNRPAHRRALGFAVLGALVFLVLTLAGSYKAYDYTQSVSFCGEICHQPMRPEYAAYRVSPHARVACVACHIGPGAGSVVRAKLSGAYQVYATVFRRFPRPIQADPTGVEPARNTCERCHWPDRFWGDQLRVFTHFAADEANTPREIRMLVKVGGGNPAVGPVGGIHWHMNLVTAVTYIAKDERAQEIPWIRVEGKDGTVTDYAVPGFDMAPDALAAARKRRMDCLDCHNRPSHVFRPARAAVDEALAAGRIDRTLPFVKQQAVEVLTKGYPTTAAAREALAAELDGFYARSHPKVHSGKPEAIRTAIAEVQRIYETSIFPEMKADWQTHPNNIGHLTSPGCFRCHDGQHVSADGKKIRNECEICHVVVEQREAGKVVAAAGKGFRHPVDVGDLTSAPCSSCHTGGVGP